MSIISSIVALVSCINIVFLFIFSFNLGITILEYKFDVMPFAGAYDSRTAFQEPNYYWYRQKGAVSYHSKKKEGGGGGCKLFPCKCKSGSDFPFIFYMYLPDHRLYWYQQPFILIRSLDNHMLVLVYYLLEAFVLLVSHQHFSGFTQYKPYVHLTYWF